MTEVLRVGDVVRRKEDPRHTGQIVAVVNRASVKVRWRPYGWLEDHVKMTELEKTRERLTW